MADTMETPMLHPHGSIIEQVHRVITTDQGVDPWVIAEEIVAFIRRRVVDTLDPGASGVEAKLAVLELLAAPKDKPCNVCGGSLSNPRWHMGNPAPPPTCYPCRWNSWSGC